MKKLVKSSTNGRIHLFLDGIDTYRVAVLKENKQGSWEFTSIYAPDAEIQSLLHEQANFELSNAGNIVVLKNAGNLIKAGPSGPIFSLQFRDPVIEATNEM